MDWFGVSILVNVGSVRLRARKRGDLMSATVINLIIQIIAGIAGGNAVGVAMDRINLSPAVTAIAGGLGGVALGQTFSALFPELAGVSGDIGLVSIICHFIAGGVGGAVLTAIVGLIKSRAG